MTSTSISPAIIQKVRSRYRSLYQPPAETGSRPALPHPGDIAYWVGCVGAVSALLFFATR